MFSLQYCNPLITWCFQLVLTSIWLRPCQCDIPHLSLKALCLGHRCTSPDWTSTCDPVSQSCHNPSPRGSPDKEINQPAATIWHIGQQCLTITKYPRSLKHIWMTLFSQHLFILPVVKTSLEHPVDNGLESRINRLLFIFLGLSIAHPQLGVEVYTFSWNTEQILFHLTTGPWTLKFDHSSAAPNERISFNNLFIIYQKSINSSGSKI